MHIYFSGIGGTAIGPLALIAKQAGYKVSGSDKQDSEYVQYLQKNGIDNIHIGQNTESIEAVHSAGPIDWIVFSSAVTIEHPDHPELLFAKQNNIKVSKRDDLLNEIITLNQKKLIAIAGTHGKTTTTAMLIWLLKKLEMPVSYSVGAKIPFGDMGHYDESSEYFVYECDEFDRNFLAFYPYLSLITGIDYDHHEIFPTLDDYRQAFKQFIGQSTHSIIWQSDVDSCKININDSNTIINDSDPALNSLSLIGEVNRRNAWQVVQAVHKLTNKPTEQLSKLIETFPGLSRRFEKINHYNLYSDYAHTPPKIAGCLQLAHEVSENVVVVYEPLTNRRQHYILSDYAHLFDGVKRLYWAPSYLAREDPNQHVLTPSELIKYMSNKDIAEPVELNGKLKNIIQSHLDAGDTVVCLSGGGGNSLDEWLRFNFS